MSLFQSMEISLTGVEAARLRLEAAASNLANADSSAPAGAPAYRVQRVEMRPAYPREPAELQAGAGVSARPIELSRPDKLDYDPDHPDADAEGWVRYPAVELTEELSEMMLARRAYDAGLAAYSEAREMLNRSLEIGRS